MKESKNARATRSPPSPWKSRSPRRLSEEDERQIRHNVVGFFNVLAQWSAAERITNGTCFDDPEANHAR